MMRIGCRMKGLGLVVALALVCVAGEGRAEIVIDPYALGAVEAQMTAPGGQTFVDIGTTLGEPPLAGIDLNVEAVSNGSPDFFFQTPSGPGSPWGLKNGTATFTFSEPVAIVFRGGGSLLAFESDEYGPPSAGSLTSVHAEAGLLVTDDSVTNTTSGTILTNGANDGIVWESTQAGTTWSFAVSSGNQGVDLYVVPPAVPALGPGGGALLALALTATARRFDGRRSERST